MSLINRKFHFYILLFVILSYNKIIAIDDLKEYYAHVDCLSVATRYELLDRVFGCKFLSSKLPSDFECTVFSNGENDLGNWDILSQVVRKICFYLFIIQYNKIKIKLQKSALEKHEVYKPRQKWKIN